MLIHRPNFLLRRDCETLIRWCEDEIDLARVGLIIRNVAEHDEDIEFLRGVWKRKQKEIKSEDRKRKSQ